MSAKLEIVWDGTAQGLAERRLSLEAFGPALKRLLIAIRRIANELEMKARGPLRDERNRGRLAREAANLDVQLVSIRSNSPVMLEAIVVPVDTPARPLIADLPEVAVDEFLSDVEREARGAPAHFQVRQFLKALPKGLEVQKYIHLSETGAIRRSVELGAIKIADIQPAPYLVEVSGALVGFSFDDTRPEIKVRSDSGELVTFAATQDQVEQALALRRSDVDVLAVSEPTRTRLLRLTFAPPETLSAAERTDYLFRQWDGLLARLAR
jgi:hypothetical protein